MSVANTYPTSTSFKQTISFTTKDANTNNSVAEGYIVNGPTSAGVTPISIPGKELIPLSASAANGAPYLKFWLPNTGSGNTMYMTYAVRNTSMADGYYDYQTGVPASYLSSLKSWINTNPATGTQYSTPILTTVRSRTLKFTTYGSATNDPSAAITFYVTFTATFGTISSTVVATTTTAPGAVSVG